MPEPTTTATSTAAKDRRGARAAKTAGSASATKSSRSDSQPGGRAAVVHFATPKEQRDNHSCEAIPFVTVVLSPQPKASAPVDSAPVKAPTCNVGVRAEVVTPARAAGTTGSSSQQPPATLKGLLTRKRLMGCPSAAAGDASAAAGAKAAIGGRSFRLLPPRAARLPAALIGADPGGEPAPLAERLAALRARCASCVELWRDKASAGAGAGGACCADLARRRESWP
jgi:hypothetical protein